jgi:S1-C subfamily serine protease
MKIDSKFKKIINYSVVRIIAEVIDINWKLPYLTEEPSSGQGTGFFINNNGYILTCSHVVEHAKNVYIEIPFKGSEKYECDIISICPYFDIALLKTKNYKSLYFLKLGDSNKLDSGKEVQVIGYPTSIGSKNNLKYTFGIISGQQAGMIQTDSAINPGNSGGPLICNNKVIGINSMKLVSHKIDNIGYSIPINNYKVIKDDLKKNNLVFRPKLSLEYNNTNKDIIKKITKGKTDKGIIVSRILENSIFNNKKKNLKVGSIITEINNIKINNYGYTDNYKWLGTNISIYTLLNQFKNNDYIKIKYYNNDKLEESKYKLTPYILPVRKIYSIFEKVDYFIIGGVVLMNFSVNHVAYNNDINLIYSISDMEELIKPRVIISFIFPNGKIDILNNIKINNFLTKINDIDIKQINEINNALNKPLIINGKKYIKLEDNKNKYIILSIEDIIKEDMVFSNIYKYPLNDFHNKHIKNLDI